MTSRFFLAAILLASFLRVYAADSPSIAPNSDPTYQQLRNLTLGSEAVTVSNFTLKRDAGTFHLHSGMVCFVTPVQGKVTGAVFVGEGNFVLDPPLESERQSLKLLTKENEFSESFSQAVLRFTDSTYDEIKKGGSPVPPGCDMGLLKDSQNTTRHKLKDNLEARIFEDVLSSDPGGLFVAFIHGKRYNGKELFVIDPHSSSDQVELMTYDESKFGVWMGYSLSRSDKSVSRNRIHVQHQQLDTTIEKSGNLTGKASTEFVSLVDGLHVVPLELFHTLRVDSVAGDGGVHLPFIQEDKHDDADFAVILPKPLAAGEKYTVTVAYSGKDAVTNEGGGNYYPVARSSWFPNNPSGGLGEYTAYDMIFHIPKGMRIVATGEMVSETNDGGQNLTVWKSGPQTVAGFNFGRFKVEEVKLTKPEYLVQSWANETPPNWVQGLQHPISPEQESSASRHVEVSPQREALGTMSTAEMNKRALAEAQLAVQLYTDYFGPSSFKRLAVTQQTACSFGQSWPALVWLPTCYFFDTTVRHSLGMDWGDRGYWNVVTPHEVAHQWWGHTVGFNSYRDQWMSEGFADFSASLYLQTVYAKEPKRYFTFWNDEREILTERNKEGYRAIDAGPLTMGYRLSNTRTGFDTTRRLIYPKGAYILQMMRMMMWNRKTGDQSFKAAMQDFVKTYSGKAATTEDFKAMMEKHMTQEMDLEGNHRLDWFFNEYVYGTALPTYKIAYTFDKDPSGDVVFGFKVTQSGVDDKFRMLVPIYLEFADGHTQQLGRARLIGNTTIEQKVPMKGVKDAPKRALLNYNADVLASN
jgi:hypothetical protein